MASPMPNLGAILKPLADAIKGLTASVGAAGASLVNIGKSVADAFGGLGSAVGATVTGIAKAVNVLSGGLIGGLISAVGSGLSAFGSAVVGFIGPPLARAASAVKDAFATIGGVVLTVISPLTQFVGVVGSLGVAVAQSLGTVTASVAQFAASAVGVGVKIVGAFTAAVSSTSQLVGSVAGMLKGMADAGANALKKPFQVLDTLIGSMSQGITRFVALYDPGRVAVFQYSVDSLYAAIGQALAPAMDAVTQIIRSISSAIAGAGEQGKMLISALALGTIGMIAFAAAMAALQAVMSGGILPIIAGLVGAIGGFALASGMLKPLLDKLAPIISGVMDVLGEALERVTAVVQGPLVSGLQKFVEFGSKFVSYLAGAFERMGPAIGTVFEIIDAIRPAFEAIFGTVYGNFVEVIVLVAQEFQKLAPQIIAVTTIISDWVVGLMALVREIINSLGLYTIPDFEKMATPKGGTKNAPPPVRGTSTGDVESALRKARESAFSLGGGGEKPEVKTADNTGGIKTSTDAIRQQMNGLINDVKQILRDAPIWITEVLPNKIYGYLMELGNMVVNFLGGSLKQVEREAGEVARGERTPGNFGVDTPAGRVELQDIVPGFRVGDWYGKAVKGR